MKKTFAGLGVLALVALGITGASFPANADVVQPVAEIVVQTDAIVASPDAVLSQSEPAVTTTVAEVPTEPVAVVVEPVTAPEPVVTPVAPVEPVEAPVPVAVVAETPEAPEATPEPVAVVEAPAVDVPLDYWVTSDGSRMALFQGDAIEAFALYQIDVPELTFDEQNVDFGNVYRGIYMAGYAPADTKVVPSVINPATVYAFNLR